jgi:hypothetical protein
VVIKSLRAPSKPSPFMWQPSPIGFQFRPPSLLYQNRSTSYYTALKMEAADASETFVNFDQTARCHFPEDILHMLLYTLKSDTFSVLFSSVAQLDSWRTYFIRSRSNTARYQHHLLSVNWY